MYSYVVEGKEGVYMCVYMCVFYGLLTAGVGGGCCAGLMKREVEMEKGMKKFCMLVLEYVRI